MSNRLSILVEEDQDLPVQQAAGGALQCGLLALGTVLPQTLALVGIAYAPLLAMGMPLNPLWCLWSAIVGILLMLILTRERGAVYAVRPGAALLYASTVATCAGLAPTLHLQPMGVLGLAAATMTLAGLVIWLALALGATQFARYLPAPVGRGLSLGFGLTILWLQAKTVIGWFFAKGHFQHPPSAVAGVMLLAILLTLVLGWRKKFPTLPYLLALLPVAYVIVWCTEWVTSIPFDWVATPKIASPVDLLPPVLMTGFSAEVLRAEQWPVLWSAFTLLLAQALFVAFTFLVDSAGNAANLENLTGDAFDLKGELRASATSMAILPWFGLLPASTLIAATKPLYDNGLRNGANIRMGNYVVVLGLLGAVALVMAGVTRVPGLFVVAGLITIGLNLLAPDLFQMPGRGVGQKELWWQTWLIGLVFVFSSGIFAMLAGFAVAVAQLVRGAEGSIVRSVYTLKELRSRRWRGDEEEALIRRAGERAVVVMLQGTASFAVARRIREEISRIVNPKQMDVLMIDAQRVTSWDVTALEAFKKMADEFQRTHVEFLLTHPTSDVRKVLSETVMLFSNNDKALEWAENELLRRQGMAQAINGKPYQRLDALPLVAPMSDEGRRNLSAFGKLLTLPPGTPVFQSGDTDGSLLIVLAGNVSIEVQGGSEPLRVAGFGPGMVFGEMAFLDGSPRSGKATVISSCQLFLLTRQNFGLWAQQYPHDAQILLNSLAIQLSQRLRFTTGQLIALNP